VVANTDYNIARETEEFTDKLSQELGGIAKTFNSIDNWEAMITPKYFVFNETPKISTYLYAIVAGPFDFV
jgi:hypothetical protein